MSALLISGARPLGGDATEERRGEPGRGPEE